MCLYVRNIRMPEGRKLQRMVRRDANRIKMRRAQVILASDQGSKVPDIARDCDGDLIRQFRYKPYGSLTGINALQSDGTILAALDAETHPFGIHDMLAMDRKDDPQVATDSSRIVVVLGTTDLEANRGRTDLWLAGSDDSGLRQVRQAETYTTLAQDTER